MGETVLQEVQRTPLLITRGKMEPIKTVSHPRPSYRMFSSHFIVHASKSRAIRAILLLWQFCMRHSCRQLQSTRSVQAYVSYGAISGQLSKAAEHKLNLGHVSKGSGRSMKQRFREFETELQYNPANFVKQSTIE